MSKNAGPTFCDIQQLVDRAQVDSPPPLVPVCMPIKKCKLLSPSDCAASETCALVTETGATGCVAIGSASAGASCDSEHCGVGLTCLGSAGDRRCYQLCTTTGTECTNGQVCTTGTLFQDTTYGVCKDPSR